mmetsp:Transcript_4824/g.12055  ORF Transcript_4824/g.12055 Transcript_4824/m.12055 type:complete len:204 (-) Transcript_4824:165-776(-)|eukprot:CAMPEP_0177671428 /NCGR_PEP_ID=MMETSP0447-20121125/24700_1 /TAXON_ID=0 /ORGANISM="Stygamoeba regulata, Strain BSH-02190019" /LENGTH=203 /DNA_ID=CAMNT_0019178823 /DNA_START=380 /DNA_END=991 /DNA_ORIENTATION=-
MATDQQAGSGAADVAVGKPPQVIALQRKLLELYRAHSAGSPGDEATAPRVVPAQLIAEDTASVRGLLARTEEILHQILSERQAMEQKLANTQKKLVHQQGVSKDFEVQFYQALKRNHHERAVIYESVGLKFSLMEKKIEQLTSELKDVKEEKGKLEEENEYLRQEVTRLYTSFREVARKSSLPSLQSLISTSSHVSDLPKEEE